MQPSVEDRTVTADNGPPSPAGRRSRRHWVVLGLLALVLAVWLSLGPGAAAAWDVMQAHLEVWQSWVNRHLALALVIYLVIGTVSTALPLPVMTLLTLLAGGLFGRWLGAGVVSLAYTLGVTIAFLLARFLLRDLLRERFGPRLRRMEHHFEKDGAVYLLTLRLMPSIPFFLINVLMALTSIRLRTYMIMSWLGVLPLSFLYAGVGTELATLESPAEILSWPVVLSLAALALVPLLIRHLFRWGVWRQSR